MTPLVRETGEAAGDVCDGHMTNRSGNQLNRGPLAVIRTVVSIYILVLCAWAPGVGVAAPEATEGALYAAWLRHLCQETRWERENEQGPFKIVLIGKDRSKIADAIRAGIASDAYLIQERKVSLTQVDESDVDEPGVLSSAHMVVFLQSDAKVVQSVVQSLKGRDVLTVATRSGRQKDGVMVELLRKNRRMSLTVVYPRVQACGLTMHSDFLALGDRSGGPIEIIKEDGR